MRAYGPASRCADLWPRRAVTDVEDPAGLSDAVPSRRPATPSFVAELPTLQGVHHFVDVSRGCALRQVGLVLRSRVGATTRARKRPRSAHGVSGGRERSFPLPPCWRRVQAARHHAPGAATTQRQRRQANQHWVVRENRAINGPRRSLPHYYGRSAPSARARHAGSKHDHAGAFGANAQAPSFIDEAVAASSLTPGPYRGHDALVLGASSSQQPARANEHGTMGVERATMRPILAAPRIVWGARRDAGEPDGPAMLYGRYINSVVVPPDRSHCMDRGPDITTPVLEVDGSRHEQHHDRRARSSAPS